MTIKLFPENEKIYLSKEKVIEMENLFLNILDFNLTLLSPLSFLERFLRLTNTDCDQKLSILAKEICFVAKCKSQFLNFKSSYIAACALIIAHNMCFNNAIPSLKVWDS